MQVLGLEFKPTMRDVRWLDLVGVLLLVATLVTPDTPEPNVSELLCIK